MKVDRYVYNSLNKFVRRIINHMKTNEFRTGLIMALIPLAFALAIEAINATNMTVKISLDLTAFIAIVAVFVLWTITWNKLKKEENDNKTDNTERIKRDKHLIAVIDAIAIKMGINVDKLNDDGKSKQ